MFVLDLDSLVGSGEEILGERGKGGRRSSWKSVDAGLGSWKCQRRRWAWILSFNSTWNEMKFFFFEVFFVPFHLWSYFCLYVDYGECLVSDPSEALKLATFCLVLFQTLGHRCYVPFNIYVRELIIKPLFRWAHSYSLKRVWNCWIMWACTAFTVIL